jgi:hypothetical protein
MVSHFVPEYRFYVLVSHHSTDNFGKIVVQAEFRVQLWIFRGCLCGYFSILWDLYLRDWRNGCFCGL